MSAELWIAFISLSRKVLSSDSEALMGILNSVVGLERQNHAGDFFGW